MKKPSGQTLFLEKAPYRRRRLRDAARMLPLLGCVLFGIPLMWSQSDAAPFSNADALIYVFGAWIVLILLSALISYALRVRPEDP